MRRWVALLCMACGCGRSGFADLIDASGDGASSSTDAPLDPIDAPPGSVVTTFGETPTATIKNVTRDTYITSEFASSSYGGATTLKIEGSQALTLLRFDLSSIPSGTQILSARFHVRVASVEFTSTLNVSPILETWTEGTSNGTSGVANYTQRTATQNWTTAGAGTPGSSGAIIATAQVTGAGAIAIDLPAATVQGWVDTPTSNFGVAFTATGGDITAYASNDTTATERPELVLTYLP